MGRRSVGEMKVGCILGKNGGIFLVILNLETNKIYVRYPDGDLQRLIELETFTNEFGYDNFFYCIFGERIEKELTYKKSCTGIVKVVSSPFTVDSLKILLRLVFDARDVLITLRNWIGFPVLYSFSVNHKTINDFWEIDKFLSFFVFSRVVRNLFSLFTKNTKNGKQTKN